MANATHLRLRYDVASVLTLLLLLASQGPALADGGAGGNAYGGTGGAGGVGYSGQNGEDGGSFPSVGGGGGAAGGGSGGGNADGAAPGLGGTAGSRNGQAGGDQIFGAAGAGGGGGYNGNGAGAPSLNNSTTLLGGDGGRGGDTNNGGNAGGGGAGGYGAIVTGGFLNTNNGFVVGGTGGRGGITNNGGGAGSAGDGGIGILFTGASATLNNTLSGFITGGAGGAGGNTTNGGPRGAGGDGGAGIVGNILTITNAGTIRGGNGGMVGFGADQGTTAGSGGAGIIGSGLNIQNTGVIQGGSNGGGGTANAITFTGGNNVLALSNTSNIIGDIGLAGQLELQQLTSGVVLSNAITGTGAVTKTGATTLTLTGANTFTGGTTISQGTLQIGDGGTSGSLLGNITNNGTLAFNRSDNPTFAGVISGSGSVTKLGAGSLTLTGVNMYSGGTNLNSGTLVVSNAAALGTGTLAVNGPAVLTATLGGMTLPNAVTLNGATLTVENITGFSMAGAISGTGNLVKDGTTPLELTGANTYVGSTTIRNGTLMLNANGTLGATTNTTNVLDTGSLYLGGRTHTQAALNLSGRVRGGTMNVSQFQLTDGTVVADATINVSSTFDLQAGTVNGVLAGAGTANKTSPGTVVLTNANTYTGGTNVLTGTLEIQNGDALGGGGVALNGGHLRSNIAGTATLANPLSLVNGSLISAAPGQTLNLNLAQVADGAIVLLGSASDTGTLVTTGAGIATAGSSTVEVNGGTVRAGSAQLPGLLGSATRLTLANNATLDLVGFGASIRDLWGAGTLTGSGGTLQILAGDFDGRLTGAVGLDKVSADPLTLDGVSTYTGPTTVRAGYLGVNGSLVSAVSVLNGAALGGNGTIGGLAVQSGGTVAPGNSIGTLNVAGNVSFAPGSVYAVEINAAGQSDRIAATGTATLSGGTVMVLPDQGLFFAENTPYTILTAQGGVTGQFAGTHSAEFAFVSPTLGYATNAVTLTMVRKSAPQPEPPTPTPPMPTPPTPPAPTPLAFHSVALSQNQYRTADAVEALRAGHRLYDTVLGSSVSGARQAFDALSGEAHASAITTGYAQAQLIQAALLNRLRQPLLGSSVPQLAQGSYAAAFAADRPGRAVAPVAVEPAPVPPRYALWGEGFGSWGKVRSNGNSAALDASTGGFVLGADALVSDGIRLGLAGGYLSTSFDVDARLSSGTSDSLFGALYGAGQWGALNLRFGAMYARHDFDVSRTISFPAYADATRTSYDGSTLQGFGEIGYRLGLGTIQFEPFAGASVLRLSTERFQEQGGAAALTGYGRSYELGTTTLGLRAEARLSAEVPLTLKGLLGWRHAYGDVAPQALLAFAGGVSPFAVSGVPVDRDALVAEAGLAWQASQALSLGVNYSGQIGNRAQEHSLKGNLTWQFDSY